MLKINLLERKVAASGPLADLLARLGLSDLTPEDKALYINTAIKIALLLLGIYISDYVPEQMRQKKLEELSAKNDQLDMEKGKLNQQLKAKEAVRVEMDRMTAQENELKGKLNIISSLDADRYRAFKVLDTLSMLIPDRVWIENITFTPKTLDFNGSSWEFIPINDFVSLLKQSGVFENVILTRIDSALSSKIVPGVPLALQTLKKYSVTMELKAMQATDKSAEEKAVADKAAAEKAAAEKTAAAAAAAEKTKHEKAPPAAAPE